MKSQTYKEIRTATENRPGSDSRKTTITKTYLYNFDPPTPLTLLLYSKTGVYRGIHYFFLISAQNIDCGYSLEVLSENFQFLVVKFSIYSNRRIFVMKAKSRFAVFIDKLNNAASDQSLHCLNYIQEFL